jgi:predicted DNA-binding protein (MmcQ/YjbR family)
MDKSAWIDFCTALGPTFADTPFAKMEKGVPTVVVRHLKNKKGFADLSEREGKLIIAVKQNPLEIEELREIFHDITPAWHMNKTHWNDICIGGDVSDKAVKSMILASYELVKPKG